MSISNIVTTVNGKTAVMENATIEQYCHLIKFLEGQEIAIKPVLEVVESKVGRTMKAGFIRRNTELNLNNCQIEPSKSYQPTTDDFNLDKALGLPCISWSVDAKTSMSQNSVQVLVRKAIITFFILNNNKPAKSKDIISFVLSEGLSTYKGAMTYKHHLYKMGVLAKDTDKDMFHLSRWFLSQVK